ncbi:MULTISPECIES: hypothetical protein [Colwellia]|uniref:Uncharacterized protein n=1 Tax=Colwellia marinimaniae TaxID=1513592 RepID=A0ABQ0MVL3_9GAMM|nr:MULTISPECIES: hypothetical protein [Colwellia]GAW96403.1 hypothetical protein MTCD1_02017 [Colwellia marinimaniae]
MNSILCCSGKLSYNACVFIGGQSGFPPVPHDLINPVLFLASLAQA